MAFDYITVTAAVARGYASRRTLMRWAKDGSVRSYVRGNHRYVHQGDVIRRLSLRQTGTYGATDEELADRLADQIVMAKPALTDDERARLAALLTDGR